MSVVVINENIEVPNVYEQDIDPDIIGDSDRTALGTLRTDVVTAKDEWVFEARYLTYDEYQEIKNYLITKLYTAVDFWYDEFGGTPANDSIQAKIEIIGDERVQFRRDGTFHDDGRNLTLEVIEK